ncbi:hypothetical protein AB8U03_08415 [Clostridium sp. Mt-5]|uniref:Histidine kinase n=1 Tax=Clostridium moutaii TaxID=3240932 RepID=A0ABV4BN67_9CLOT
MDKNKLKLLLVMVFLIEIALLLVIFKHILFNNIALVKNIFFVGVIITSVILYNVIMNAIFNLLAEGEKENEYESHAEWYI